MKRRVVITGMGIISAHGTGIEDNWLNVAEGRSGIKEIESFDSSRYRGCSGGEAAGFTDTHLDRLKNKRLDRASLLLIHAVREALSKADIINSINDEDIILSLGTTLGGMLSGQMFHQEAVKKGIDKARVSLVSDYLAHYQPVNIFREFDLRGDTIMFSDACASGANAIGYAYRCIGNGEHNTAVCGGYDTMSEFTFAGFNSLMAVSPAMCRPFDINRDGLVLGEGAGILVLEELRSALGRNANIFAEIIGYGKSSDAYHMTSPDPSGRQASNAISSALKDAGNPDIDYINAHGTGTKFNDAMETAAITHSFGDRAVSIPVSSVKPMIGHILGGAGAVEGIISILSIINKTLPPNLNYNTPDPDCGLNIVRETSSHEIKTALSNSFGFGGSNASLIFREYPCKI
ncbi:MAG: beta-ketoacyl-[acyl-carrier-protein] synthase family protein [Nitrospirota bacterium]